MERIPLDDGRESSLDPAEQQKLHEMFAAMEGPGQKAGQPVLENAPVQKGEEVLPEEKAAQEALEVARIRESIMQGGKIELDDRDPGYVPREGSAAAARQAEIEYRTGVEKTSAVPRAARPAEIQNAPEKRGKASFWDNLFGRKAG